MAGTRDREVVLFIRWLIIAFFMSFLSSCGSGGINTIGGGGVTAYLPYIESISTDPAVVVEGEPYDVIAHVSCQLNPDVLRGGPADISEDQSTDKWHWTLIFDGSAISVSNPGEVVIVNNPWIAQPAQSGSIVDSFVVRQMYGSEEGVQTFQVLTADSPEWGGLESTYYPNPSNYVEDHPHAVYREFEITVLPAEETAE